MTEYQAVIIAILFVIICLALSVAIPLDYILRRLRSIEKLLAASSEQYVKNKDKVSSGDSKNEQTSK